MFMCNQKSVMMPSVNAFKVMVHGRGAHGAYPRSSAGLINNAVHLYPVLEALIARKVGPSKNGVLMVRNLTGGSASGIIPDCVF